MFFLIYILVRFRADKKPFQQQNKRVKKPQVDSIKPLAQNRQPRQTPRGFEPLFRLPQMLNSIQSGGVAYQQLRLAIGTGDMSRVQRGRRSPDL